MPRITHRLRLDPWGASPAHLLEEYLRKGSFKEWKAAGAQGAYRILRRRLFVMGLINSAGVVTKKGRELQQKQPPAAPPLANQPRVGDVQHHTHVRVLGPDKPRYCRVGRAYRVAYWKDDPCGKYPTFYGEHGQFVDGRIQGGDAKRCYPFWEAFTPKPKGLPEILSICDEVKISEQFAAWWKDSPAMTQCGAHHRAAATNAAQCAWREAVRRLAFGFSDREILALAEDLHRVWNFDGMFAADLKKDARLRKRWLIATREALAQLRGRSYS